MARLDDIGPLVLFSLQAGNVLRREIAGINLPCDVFDPVQFFRVNFSLCHFLLLDDDLPKVPRYHCDLLFRERVSPLTETGYLVSLCADDVVEQ